jgi:hypothetical protein
MEKETNPIPSLFVYPADLAEGEEFFNEFWPEARAVSDPEGRLFAALGISRASLRQIFGPSVWRELGRARQRGYRGSRIIGNPWLLPGLFLVRNREIVWRFIYSNIGDHPDFDEVLAQIQRCRTRKSDAEEKGPEGQRSSVLG